MFLIGCTNINKDEIDLNQVTRVDVDVVKEDGNYEETKVITDEETIDVLRKTLSQIKWEPNVQPSMARIEDVKATIFFKNDKNMPERLVEYQIWFNEDNETAMIISNHEKQGFGTLDKDTYILKGILLNK